MEAYLDNSATTRVLPEVVELMNKIYLEDYGNPSSKHLKGIESERYILDAKEIIAKTLKAKPEEILFTSGGTESDNTALFGVMRANTRRGKHMITSMIEHHAILATAHQLEKEGYEVTYLPVDKYGQVSPESLKEAIRPDTVLVSVMHTNNEIGSVNNLEELSKVVKDANPEIYFHTDAVQGYTKSIIIPKRLGIDLLSVSGHKIHGPKGVGFLYVNEKVKMNPFVYGGGQQSGRRSGTENVPGIAGMALAAKTLYDDFDNEINKLYELKDYLVKRLSDIEGTVINGHTGRDSAPHIVSVSVRGVRAEVLLHALEEKGVYVSSGSACASNRNTVSETLASINIERDLLDSTIRLSFSIFTTMDEVKYAADCIEEIIPELRKYTRR
ncbi:MAG TPA: cysteine desulfurase NifS [Lachnospiraceae bacterium]|nr:cysteine desulfurase NifS [Lachnospiraceae bacterium]